MKVLYAIQGTGNGHISRARAIIPILQNYCSVDILVSGYQSDVDLPFEVKYKMYGLSFIFGKNGGVDKWNTFRKANIKKLQHETKTLPVEDYNFVINDFEPVSAWACYKKKVPCISLSHQAAVIAKNAPKPKKIDLFGKFILRNYAPSNIQFGIHFSNYAPNIFTPVIRPEIRYAKIEDLGHYTVYLPSYSDKRIIKILSQIEHVNWKVFSKHSSCAYSINNIDIEPISNKLFVESIQSCTGLLCNAGFEAPAEALFMGKKLLAIPMKGQYEQQCNAAALEELGVATIKKLSNKKLERIRAWVKSEHKIEINYPDNSKQMINQIFASHIQDLICKNNWNTEFSLNFKSTSILK